MLFPYMFLTTPTSSSLALGFVLASRGLMPYLRHHFLDTTFKGLYQVNGFDLVLLIPYFIVLIILAAYGGHRYWLVYLYYKNKANKTTEPAAHFPSTTCRASPCSCPSLTSNTSWTVSWTPSAGSIIRKKTRHPMLDDSTDETVEVARILVERYAALGNPVEYLHRNNREGFKAGALAEGLKTAKGEFVAIFDADFVPPPDFLLNCIHHFTDPKVGMVQTRWTHINRNYSC